MTSDEFKNNNKFDIIRLKVSTMFDYVERFCFNVRTNAATTEKCKSVVKKVSEEFLISENTLPVITSMYIYYVCMMSCISVSKRKLTLVCNIFEVIISKCYKRLKIIDVTMD